MILIEECRLRLDDPIDALLPELANRGVLRTLDSELDVVRRPKRQENRRANATINREPESLRPGPPPCPWPTAAVVDSDGQGDHLPQPYRLHLKSATALRLAALAPCPAG